MVTRILLLLLVFVSPLSQALNTLTASVAQNPAMAGQTIVLTITADDSLNANDLDTSALLKDFIVGRTNISRNTQVINGKVNRQSSWTIELIAREPGQYTIAPFTIDNVSSAEISLSVVEATSTVQKNSEIMLKTTLSSDSAYVGQQLIYTVKLYIGASLQRALLQMPELANAEISQLGEDVDSNERVNGMRYRVITRRYAIRPSEAGNVELQGSIFRGDIQQGQRGFFGSGRSKPVTLLSDNHQLSISAIPDDFPGPWLISDLVILEQSWSEPTTFRVGEPITRTLTLTAANITKEQLPELTANFPAGIQAYPDKAINGQSLNGDVMIAQSVQKIAIIPSQAGELILPAIKVPWFNAATRQLDWAIIEQQTINVVSAKPVQQPTAPVVAAPAQKPVPEKTTIEHPVAATPATIIYWQLACAALLTISLILAAALWRQRSLQHSVIESTSNVNTDKYWQLLTKALTTNNYREVIRLMPLWLTDQFSISPEQLSESAPRLYNIYQQLIANCYAKETTENNCKEHCCKELLKLATEFQRRQHHNDKNSDALYPAGQAQ